MVNSVTKKILQDYINEQIKDYPTPITGCDIQFDYLLAVMIFRYSGDDFSATSPSPSKLTTRRGLPKDLSRRAVSEPGGEV